MNKNETFPWLLDLRSKQVAHTHKERLCRLFYQGVYREAFPNPQHAERPETWLPLLQQDAPEPKPFLHLMLALRAKRPIAQLENLDLLGGVIFEFFRGSNAALITYVCVRPEARRRGVARALISHAIATCTAYRPDGGVMILAETEDPKRKNRDTAEFTKACERLVTLDALGFQRVPVAYIQPPLSPASDWVDLLLLIHAPNGDLLLERRRIENFLREFERSLEANWVGRKRPVMQYVEASGGETKKVVLRRLI